MKVYREKSKKTITILIIIILLVTLIPSIKPKTKDPGTIKIENLMKDLSIGGFFYENFNNTKTVKKRFEEGKNSVVVWKGFEHSWSYNHRLNRLGSWIDIKNCHKTGCNYTLGHSGASGSGEDIAYFNDSYSEISTKYLSFISGSEEFDIEGREGEKITGEIKVIAKDSSKDESSNKYVALINGIDIYSKKDPDKLESLNVKITGPKETKSGINSKIKYSIKLDCKTLECSGEPLKTEGKQKTNYGMRINYVLIKGKNKNLKANKKAKTIDYSWRDCKGAGDYKCGISKKREINKKPRTKDISIKGKKGFGLGFIGIKGISIDLERGYHYNTFRNIVEGKYYKERFEYKGRLSSFFKEWTAEPPLFKSGQLAVGKGGNAKLKTELVLVQTKKGCKKSFVEPGNLHWKAEHKERKSPKRKSAKIESNREFIFEKTGNKSECKYKNNYSANENPRLDEVNVKPKEAKNLSQYIKSNRLKKIGKSILNISNNESPD